MKEPVASTCGLPKSYFNDLKSDHEAWLRYQSSGQSSAWQQRFNSDQQGAMAEAWVRQLLMPLVEKIESHEVPGQGGLDFLCTPKASSTVKCLTEVTNIDSAAISAKTGLTESIDDWEGGAIVSIVKKLMSKKQDKKKQIAKSVANLPLVRAITIFHEIIAHEHFLQSGTARLLRPETQRYFPNPCNLIAPTRSTWEAPIFNDSSFFKRGAGPKSYQSACLVLNPTAGRPISPDLLSDIQCCRLLYGWIMVDPCQWQVEWIDNPK